MMIGSMLMQVLDMDGGFVPSLKTDAYHKLRLMRVISDGFKKDKNKHPIMIKGIDA